VHQHDQGLLGVRFQHDGLDRQMFVDAEFARGAPGAAVVHIRVDEGLVVGLAGAQGADGGGDGNIHVVQYRSIRAGCECCFFGEGDAHETV
jgi:hypothetical protein